MKHKLTYFIKYHVQDNQRVATEILEHRSYLFLSFSYQILL